MSSSLSSGAHVLVFPYPAPGHMMPLLELAHKLSTRGLTITILVTPKNLPILRPLLSAHPSITPLVLRPNFPTHPSPFPFPSAAENTFPAIMHAMRQLHSPILQWFRAHPKPPVAIVSDMFLWWTQHLACELGIPRYMFSPSGVMAMSIIYSLRQYPPETERDDANANDPYNNGGLNLITLSRIPNSPIYPWWQLKFLYSAAASYVEGDPISEFMRDGVVANMASWGMVFNSFNELERIYLEHLMLEAGHDRVWAVGPLLPADPVPVENIINTSSPSPSDSELPIDGSNIISWLDACGDRTVVFVCFGSQAVLGNNQMERIAAGLEKSGASFLWCIKEAPQPFPFPSGFEDRTAGRGLVFIGWAPQLMILRHPAVGAFLTHCGWNSILEGLMAGVPMLAWPMEGEQFLNATLLVDELKVARRVSQVPDSDELARVFAESILNNNLLDNSKSKELRMAALDAVGDGGSSNIDLDRLAVHLSRRPINFADA